jgi:hypothetical protein
MSKWFGVACKAWLYDGLAAFHTVQVILLRSPPPPSFSASNCIDGIRVLLREVDTLSFQKMPGESF